MSMTENTRAATSAAEAAPAETTNPSMFARLAAEFFGTFFLVSGLIGTAVFSATFAGEPGNPVNVGFLGASLAIGFVVVVLIYALGPVSGGHFNPAITLGLASAGRFSWRDVVPYIAAQIVGGAVGTSLLWFYAHDRAEVGDLGNFASNGFGEHSPGGFGFWAVVVAEVILTAFLVVVVLGVTSKRAAAGFAGLAIGLTLTVIHLVSIPISNTSVNPARSIATALYGGEAALSQLWVFLVFPSLGGIIAGLVFAQLFDGVKRSAAVQS